MERIRTELFALRDMAYRDFQAALIPTIDRESVIGVRMPVLRRYAKQLRKEPERCAAFLAALPHRYYDENMLHALLLSAAEGPFEEILPQIERFLPYLDNWAVCDGFSPAVFSREPERTYACCLKWLDSAAPYTVRFSVVTLLKSFVRERFAPAVLDRLAALRTDEYYINMAVAWYLSEALVYHYEAVLPCLTQRAFDPWVHNKAIQKARESFRITPEQKAFLQTLRIGARPKPARGRSGSLPVGPSRPGTPQGNRTTGAGGCF